MQYDKTNNKKNASKIIAEIGCTHKGICRVLDFEEKEQICIFCDLTKISIFAKYDFKLEM